MLDSSKASLENSPPVNLPFCILSLQQAGEVTFHKVHLQSTQAPRQPVGGGSEEAGIAGSQPLTHRMCHQHHLHQLGAAVQLPKINRNINSGLWFPVSSDSMCTRVANQGWLSTETEPSEPALLLHGRRATSK